MWIIENQEGIAVGCINTFNCNKRAGTFKYGLGINRGYWGKGYAKDAIKIVLKYYFRELRYQKVTVHIYSFNERSMKLHESLGFCYRQMQMERFRQQKRENNFQHSLFAIDIEPPWGMCNVLEPCFEEKDMEMKQSNIPTLNVNGSLRQTLNFHW